MTGVGMRRVRASTAMVSLGAGLVAVSVALAAHDRPPPADFGRLPLAAPTIVTPPVVDPPVVAPSGVATRRGSPTTSAGPARVSPAQPAPAPAASPPVTAAPPTAVTIPAIGIRASVLPVHAVNGVLGVPADPHELGWWADGAPVGSATGTVVLDGHVDSAVTGEGALFDLTRLQIGDRVLVATASGRTDRFAVVARRTYRKVDGLPPDVFRTDGPARLVLITCGGPFDQTARSYLDNIVVFASPVA